MHVNLSPEMEQYVQGKIASGLYGNASEVVRDAIERLRADDEKLAALRSAIQIGDGQIECGECIAYTPELMGGLVKKAIENTRQGKKISPDVIA